MHYFIAQGGMGRFMGWDLVLASLLAGTKYCIQMHAAWVGSSSTSSSASSRFSRSSTCLCLCGGQSRAACGVKRAAAQRVGHTNVRRKKVGRVALTCLPYFASPSSYQNIPYRSPSLSLPRSLSLLTPFLQPSLATPLPLFLLIYLTALVHDAAHPGTNNNYLIATKSPLALRWSPNDDNSKLCW